MNTPKKIFFSILLATLSFSPLGALAYKLEMSIPQAPANISDPGKYIEAFFQFGFYLVAFVAVAMLVYAGILYMVPNKIGEAKERIWGAVIGIILLACSFLLLQTINPDLLKLSPKSLPKTGTAGTAAGTQ